MGRQDRRGLFLLIIHPVQVGESSKQTSKPELIQAFHHAVGSHKGVKIIVSFSSSQTGASFSQPDAPYRT